ncbi:phosphoenolpyruvate--protein phosphotransferase [bacterium E08(2017)]|nr:phosphoenolpyruvate--protein phosphotransferase [bacterium E08(2017)]
MAENDKTGKTLKGLALSKGTAFGRVCMLNENRHSNLPMYKVEGEGVEREKIRIDKAVEIAAERIEKIRQEVQERIGPAEAEIFVAHRMIVEDPALKKEIYDYIEDEGVNAEAAVRYVLDSYEQKVLALDDEYMRTRATDFGEIKRRLLDVMGNMQPSLQCDARHCQKGKNRIIVAEELTPSLTIDINPDETIAFVTEHGGINSHAAILARAMRIPAVSGLANIRQYLGCGTELLVDGDTGNVVIWPSEEQISSVVKDAPETKSFPAPVDPVEGFKVMANISLASNIDESLKMKAEGIGLYRTEFEIIAAERYFTEDELYERYTKVGSAMAGKGVIYRLFDLGSDKTMPFMEIPLEENPALGWRGTRLLLGKEDVLVPQARALARISATEGGRIHVMYPMIVDVAQFHRVKEMFMNAIQDIPYGEILHGIMFEVPSACLQARKLFETVDFASIGTNDLIQYLFAVDRDNDYVSYDYDPDRDVFWDIIGQISAAANQAGKPLSICGELAGDPNYTAKFIELGVSRVSVSPRRISEVRLAASDYFNSK